VPDSLFSEHCLLCSAVVTELHSSVWQAVSVPCFTSSSLFLPVSVQQCYCYSCHPMLSARYKLAFLREYQCENHSCWLVEIVSIEVVVFWEMVLYSLVDMYHCCGGMYCFHLQVRKWTEKSFCSHAVCTLVSVCWWPEVQLLIKFTFPSSWTQCY